MDLNFVLELLLFCFCITELLALDSTKRLKFRGFECNETSGPAVEGLYDGQCIGKALEDSCWAFRVCSVCECCKTVMKATDNSTFLYSFAHRLEGEQCLIDRQCPSEEFACSEGICKHCHYGRESPTACRRCPSGFEFHSEFGKCYFFGTEQKNWTAAEDHCVSLGNGSHLASIHSQEEIDFLFSKIGISVWIHVGGSDAATEGNWTWIDGTPFDFVNWRPNEPNGGTGENCMLIRDDSGTIKGMNDVGCTFTARFICKTDAA